MLLERGTRILKEMMKDKRAGLGGAANVGKPLGSNASQQGPAGVLSSLQGMGAPPNLGDVAKGVWNTESSQLIEQHKQKIEELKQQKEQKEQELEQLQQQIEQVHDQIEKNEKDIEETEKAAKEAEQEADTSALEQAAEQFEKQIEQLEQAKSALQDEITEIDTTISFEEAEIDRLKGNVWKERKLNAVGLVPGEGTAAKMFAGEAEHMKVQAEEAYTAHREKGAQQGMGEAESKAQQAQQKAGQLGQQAASTKASAPPKPTAAPKPEKPSGGGGAGAGEGKGSGGGGSAGFGGSVSGMADKLIKNPLSGDKKPVGFAIFVAVSAILSGIVYKQGGAVALPSIFGILLLVAAVLVYAKTRDHRFWYTWVIIILLFGASLYFLGTRTVPYAVAAYQSGLIEEAASETVGGGKVGIGKIIQDATTSWQTSMQVATGERIEGEVDQSVKEDVGIEVLPPYLPNPKKVNLNEVNTLEIGARIKGFDPKTEMTAAIVCSMQSRQTTQSRSIMTMGELELHPGEQQRTRPDLLKGYNFDKEITCYPKPTACGDYVITLTAEADRLRTDGSMRNYIMDKDILAEKLKSYAQAKSTELRSESEVNSAIKAMYPEVGDYQSVSEKGAIKVVMATQKSPLIGVSKNEEDSAELTLRAGVENMMSGWIRNINEFRIIVPEYFDVMTEFCQGWRVDGHDLVLTNEYIASASLREVTKGQQKVFPSCHLIPNGNYELTEPTQATFLAKVDYNYIVQEKYDVEVRTATGERCPADILGTGGSSGGGGGGSGGTATTPTTSGAGTAGTTEAAGTTATTGTSDTVRDEEMDRFSQAIAKSISLLMDLCEGKTAGQNCGFGGVTGKCTTEAGALLCYDDCIYYGKTNQNGLNPQYNCVPSDQCESLTQKPFSCGGGKTCCKPKSVGSWDLSPMIARIKECRGKTAGTACSGGKQCKMWGDVMMCGGGED